MPNYLNELARRVGAALLERGLMLATAESCTGGWIAEVVTEVSGSSQWFERGFVTYSNRAKQEMLGVAATTLAAHGAVSEAVVGEMAQGAVTHSQAQAAVAVSGVAGPTGGSSEKPVGTVCLAWVVPVTGLVTERYCFQGDRQAIRQQAVETALLGLLRCLKHSAG